MKRLFILLFITTNLALSTTPIDWASKEYQDFRTFPRISKAYAMIDEGNTKEARVLLEKALKIDPNNENAINLLMNICLKEKDNTCINKYVDQAKDVNLGYFYKNKAQNAKENKNYKEAIDFANQSLEYDLKPDDVYFITLIKFDAYLKLKDYDNADKVIERDKLTIPTLLKWSKVSDNFKESDYAYQLASELPSTQEYLKWQIELLLKNKQHQEASKKMETLCEIAPTKANKKQLLYLYDLTHQDTNIVEVYEKKLNAKCDEYALEFLLDYYKNNKQAQNALLEQHYPYACLPKEKQLNLSLQLVEYLKKSNPKKAKKISKTLSKEIEAKYAQQNTATNKIELMNLYQLNGETAKIMQIHEKTLAKKCDEYALLALLDYHKKNKTMQKKLLEKHYPYACVAKKKRVSLSLQLVSLLDEKNLTRKKEIIEQLNKKDIDSSFYMDISNIYVGLNDYQKSIDYALDYVKSHPNNTLAIKNIGYSYYKLEQKDLSVHYLLQASKLDPNDLELLKNIGYLCIELKQYDTAIYYWNLYLTQTKDPTVQLELASHYYFTLKEYDKAKQALKAYEASTTKYTHKYYLLKAKFAYKNNDCKIALSSYDKALTMQQDQSVNYEYIHLLQKCQQEDKALTLMQNFSDTYPDNLQYKKELAYMYEKQKNYPKVVQKFEEIVEKEPENPSNYKALAYAYKKVGDEEKAVESFKNAIDHDKESDPVELKNMKQAIAHDSKDFNVYLSQSPRLDSYQSNKQVSPINNASYAGFGDVRLSYQPRFLPKNTLVFFDVLHGYDNVKQTAQPSVGIKYKPLDDKNIHLSAQQMIKAGKSTRSDTLLQASIGISSSKKSDSNLYQNLYLDTGYFAKANSLIAYGNYEAGKVYHVNKNVDVAPYVTTGGTYNNNNKKKQSVTKLDVGVGVAMTMTPDDTKYESAQYINKLKLEARQKYAGNAQDKNTVRLQWEFFY